MHESCGLNLCLPLGFGTGFVAAATLSSGTDETDALAEVLDIAASVILNKYGDGSDPNGGWAVCVEK